MRHVDFFHKDHFEFCYHRKKAKKSLSEFIDYFWETDFDKLYQQYPEGFSDALFPNAGTPILLISEKLMLAMAFLKRSLLVPSERNLKSGLF